MPALYFDPELENCAGRDLHDWLGGGWGLLFSNPEDFPPRGREEGPWLDRIRRELSARTVRVLAVKRDSGLPEPSWIDKLYSDPQIVWLREPSFAAADAVSFAARVLRGELLTLQSRFVFCIDGSLKRQAAFKYGDNCRAVSAPDPFALLNDLHCYHSIDKAA